jgi:chemotaxis protein histidine kinase CheA
MDWELSEELMEIYLSEVDQRSASLVEGALALAGGSLEALTLDDLVRDAHTLKGSSRMMGREAAGAAAAALEQAWRDVRAGGAIRLPVLGSTMLEVATLLPAHARDPDDAGALTNAVSALEAALQPDSDSNGLEHSNPVDELPADSLVTPEPRPAPFLPTPEPPPSTEAQQAEVTLGGLLPALESDTETSVMRVDTGALYSVINRVAEIAIELESMQDLTIVSFDENARMSAAWRDQITRVYGEVRDLLTDAVGLVTVPLIEGVETFPQFVRFLGRRLDKDVRFEATGLGLPVDRQVVDLLREPLRHLVVNAVAHGIESPDERRRAGKPSTGVVRLSARLDEDRLEINVQDDGRGIDWEKVKTAAEQRGLPTSPSELRGHLLAGGFTTVFPPDDYSGTGEGLALLGDVVDQLAGSVMIESAAGHGTTVMVDVPASIVLQRTVVVRVGSQVVGISEAAVIDVVSPFEPAPGSDNPAIVFEGEPVPLVLLAAGLGMEPSGSEQTALVLATRAGSVAVAVDEIVSQRPLAGKGLGPILDGTPQLAGAAFLGGGQVLVVADHNHLGRVARHKVDTGGFRSRVLVVDDSAGVRQLIAATLRSNGFDVVVAASADQARGELDGGAYDAVVVDYAMPGLNGAELVSGLRAAGNRIPVVMVSGVADQQDKAAAWQAGVDAYLDKYDLRRGALLEAIRALIDNRMPHRD